ncbi:MAG: transcription antitermination factor NusB [Lentisphaerae bacterium]|nr:MAG: transcription antitermination factor NusB [Lentisphaerota bacterium]
MMDFQDNEPSSRRQISGRRLGREWAMQILYKLDASQQTAIGQDEWTLLFELIMQLEDDDIPAHLRREGKKRARYLVENICEKLSEIDSLIIPHLQNWTMERLDTLDRALLRLCCFEMLFDAIPPPVAIDEALNLARRYTNGKSNAAFLNGVLDSIRKEHIQNKGRT